jgi:glycosyltransferase involved in cell wall biosynthesis
MGKPHSTRLAVAQGSGHRQTMPRISVIVPTFNNAPFILEAVQSILGQTLPPDEVIIVDDGSTDGTGPIVAAVDDSRIRYVRQDNAGVSVARNTGLSMARGDYIAFLDSDDRWRPRMLELQVGLLEAEPDVAFAFGDFLRFEHPSGSFFPNQFSFYPEIPAFPVRPGALPRTHVINGDAFCRLVSMGEIPSYTQTIVFRHDAIQGVRFDPLLRRCQDLAFVLLAAMKGSVAFTTEVLAEVRRHPGNATHDYATLDIDKLVALRAIEPHVGSGPRHAAYSVRMVRAHTAAAVTHCRAGKRTTGVRLYRDSFRIPGALGQKVKGGVRVAQAIARSLRPGPRN